MTVTRISEALSGITHIRDIKSNIKYRICTLKRNDMLLKLYVSNIKYQSLAVQVNIKNIDILVVESDTGRVIIPRLFKSIPNVPSNGATFMIADDKINGVLPIESTPFVEVLRRIKAKNTLFNTIDLARLNDIRSYDLFINFNTNTINEVFYLHPNIDNIVSIGYEIQNI